MSIGQYTLASGMVLETRRQELIAGNLAAAEIPGYKREFLVSRRFDKEMHAHLKPNTSDYLGATAGKVYIDHSQGALKQTGRALDFALSGEGHFFEVVSRDGDVMYTRNGAFHLNSEGVLVTSEGHTVSGTDGEIRFNNNDPVDRIQTTTDGFIRINNYEEGSKRDLAQFKIVKVDKEDLEKLARVSANYYTVNRADAGIVQEAVPHNDEAMGPPFNFELYNNQIELANGNPIHDMVGMIKSSRDYEMNSKILKMLADQGNSQRQTFTS